MDEGDESMTSSVLLNCNDADDFSTSQSLSIVDIVECGDEESDSNNGFEHMTEPTRLDAVNNALSDSDVSGKHQPQDYGEKGRYQCTSCDKSYKRTSHLRSHERTHTDTPQPYRCCYEGCSRVFSTCYGLTVHSRSHSGDRPYECTAMVGGDGGEVACGKAFKTSGDLQKHVRTHTGVRPFPCRSPGCTRAFTTSNIRKLHERTHTGERPYSCELCKKTFRSQTNLRSHERIHSGLRPYQCEHPGCGKAFTEYSSLFKHHVVHTHDKPYKCDQCNKTYRQASTLAIHRRVTHRVNAEISALAEDDSTVTHDHNIYGGCLANNEVLASSSAPNTVARSNIQIMPKVKDDYYEGGVGESILLNINGMLMLPIVSMKSSDNSGTGADGNQEASDMRWSNPARRYVVLQPQQVEDESPLETAAMLPSTASASSLDNIIHSVGLNTSQ